MEKSQRWITFLPRTEEEENFIETIIHESKTDRGISARTYVLDNPQTNNPSYLLKDSKGNTILPPQNSLKELKAEIIRNFTEVIRKLSA